MLLKKNFILIWKLGEFQVFRKAHIFISFPVITYTEFCGSL